MSTAPIAPLAGVTRRRFLQLTGAAGVGVLGFPALLRSQAPSRRLNLAVIGCGGRGGSNFGEMLGENIVALCDVNEKNLAAAAAKAPGAKHFRDFRKMYDALKDSEFDAVVVSTTEHTHAFATLPALKRKKHVFCEKPLTIEASGPPPHPEIAPASMTATYHYGARGTRPPVKLVWYQGTYKPPQWIAKQIPAWPDGVLFVGDQGMLLSNYSKHVLLPEAKFAGFTPPPKTIPDSIGHHKEWLHACKTGAPTTCHFGYSGPLTEANHLGNVAYRSGRKIEWQAKTMRIPNAPDAERFLRREYRQGWSLGG